ncbi:MAG: glutamate--cysteine ligase [Deltaproteobacteria bacterium]|nr:glutamate--cysteine ligase [Deltaproteobacteria bacterium]
MVVTESRRITLDDLSRYFREGCKDPARLSIGGEFELLGVDPDSARAVGYNGVPGVHLILDRLLEEPQWGPQCEGGELICLLGANGSNITLEPGGQLELSGKPSPGLGGVRDELSSYVTQLRRVTEDLAVDFIGAGMHPVSRADEIPFVNKCRYGIMAPYLEKQGRLAHTMMKETATVQVNLDYTSEEDAMEKFRTAMGITSIVSAMYANSPLSGGRPNGFMTMREHVWMHTDPDRCGLLPFAFGEDAAFEDYLHYALAVPMLFIIREGEWIPMKGIPFGEYLKKGVEGFHAIREDWDLHQSTLFPEVRLKQYLEIRGVDGQAPGMVITVPAFWMGILYDDGARKAAWELVRDWSFSERRQLHASVCRLGLHAKIRGTLLLDLARELVRIAREGLSRLGEEVQLLGPLEELILGAGKCPAEVLLEKWDQSGHDLHRLVKESSFFQSSLVSPA